jgi:phosphoglycolate phosphatase
MVGAAAKIFDFCGWSDVKPAPLSRGRSLERLINGQEAIYGIASNYRHILWDWNGTLIDDTRLCYELTMEALLLQNLGPICLETYRSSIFSPLEAFYEYLGFDFSQSSFAELSEIWHSNYMQRYALCNLHEGVLSMLEIIREAGIKQTILSALNHELLCASVAGLKINHYFESMMGQKDLLAGDKTENARHWFKSVKLDPHQVLLIGDTIHDFEVAKALNIDCILISNGLQSKTRLEACGAKVFESLTQVLGKRTGLADAK